MKILVTVLMSVFIIQLKFYLFAEETVPAVMIYGDRCSIYQRSFPAEEKFGEVEMVLVSGKEVKAFWIGKYEVTQKLYESVMGDNPSYFKGARLPVEQVSWFNAVEFCNRLSVMTGLKQYYNIDKNRDDPENRNSGTRWTVTVNGDADGFRLPTSLEWETAVRGESLSEYFWGNEMNGDYCWYSGNSGNTTHPAGMKKPNGIGLYDTCGNVREWCFDWHPLYPGWCRIVRDGHYSLGADEIKPGKVEYRSPHFEFGFTGIRVARNR